MRQYPLSKALALVTGRIHGAGLRSHPESIPASIPALLPPPPSWQQSRGGRWPVTAWWHQHSLQQQQHKAQQPPPYRAFTGHRQPQTAAISPERRGKEGQVLPEELQGGWQLTARAGGCDFPQDGHCPVTSASTVLTDH